MNAPLNPIVAAMLAGKDPITALIGERRSVPVSALEISRYNVRTKETDLSELVALIYSVGAVLNTLVVVVHRDKKGKATGKYGVVAGGRRMRACQWLVSMGKMPADFEVPVLIVDEAQAEQLSLAENHGRMAMHPVEQFKAFASQINAGKSIETVAANYGVTPKVVERRLELAKVSPRLVAMCERDEIDLEILMAFTLTDDHVVQEGIWDSTQNWNRTAASIRQRITAGEVTNQSRYGRFVNPEEYVAGGGSIREDLFSDVVYYKDAALLEALANRKLTQIAEKIKEEGWAWVEAVPDLNYRSMQSYRTAPSRYREASSDEQAEIDAQSDVASALRQRIDELDAELEDCEDDFDEGEVMAKREALDDQGGWYAQLEQAEQRLSDLQAKLEIEHDKAQLGVVIGLDYSGNLEVRRDQLREGERIDDDGVKIARTEPDQVSENDSTGEATVKTKAVHNKQLTLSLTAHRTAALQASLTKRPEVALVAVVHQFVARRFYPHFEAGPFHVGLTVPYLKAQAADIEDSLAFAFLNAEEAKWREMLPPEVEDLFAWLAIQPQSDLVELLAFATSGALNAVQDREIRLPLADAIADATSCDMAEWWQVTGSNYLSKVSRERILSVIAEVVPASLPRLSAIGKKSDLVKAAEVELAGKNWLPEMLKQPI
ncbi:ParB/RepB/Spo0J family partition protein [Chitinimonas sp. BJB300]|nr:ParB/RepB/Spo0J family partition protein [Chitinimonas sp. BJB300]